MKGLWLGLMTAGSALAQQSAAQPAGPHAGNIKALGAFFVGLLTVIFLMVIAVALVAVARRGRGIAQEPLEKTHRPSAQTERKLGRTVGIATGLTVLILFGLVIVSVSVGKSISGPMHPANSMVVEVTGNQWWWYVRYANDEASRIVVTANEIHIPVGRAVMIRGTSNDVIHSFWVPNLQGKRDLIPSRVNTDWIEADHPGRFRGQCAEFCGMQHAHMAFWVVAEPPAEFEAWMTRQLQPAATPSDATKLRGQQVFLSNACSICHSIQGTVAAGQVGPDLTHFGSRLSIAAGTLPNNKGNLAGWIADPQNVKPGTLMATVPLKSEDVEPLLEYLESLK